MIRSITMPDRTPTQTLNDLLLELSSRPGRLGIVAKGSESDSALAWLATALNWDILPVGRVLAQAGHPPTADEIETALDGSHVFVDCQVLFDPTLRINPIHLFKRLARRNPSFVSWPGDIRDKTFSYSRPGRPDHLEESVQDAIVLRSRESAFPDQFPFTIERI